MSALVALCLIGAITFFTGGDAEGALVCLVLAWIFWEDDD